MEDITSRRDDRLRRGSSGHFSLWKLIKMFEHLIAALEKLNDADNTIGPEIKALKAEQASLAAAETTDESAITALTARVTAMEGASSPAPGASEADLTALTGRVTALEAGLGALDATFAPGGADGAPLPVTLTPSTLPDPVVGTPYASQINAAGGSNSGFQFSIAGGALPDGLSLGAGGSVTGTPTTAGASDVTVQAHDSNNDVGSQAYTLTVDAAATPDVAPVAAQNAPAA